ncbi:hypothetical protein P154DRAFT_562923 [Amniculicola lignicola CBS 123094]|uniref:Uncharacterized protein n=1 Tax=Amniculicola lignicola CBS 123094 TaxID=1392246 RepID=A0A6A5WLK8_9PLEO|nr:hypothetical protein P154DRAFT_562923 [Amniculicola lignicola CBS 123094]
MAVKMENVVVPIDLSAFVLTPECANNSGPARIAPIVQPNYIGLRLDEALMQHDLVEHIDFHNTTPAKLNTRLTDIGATNFDVNPPKYRRNRMGVYLHWSLPRCYRAANRATKATDNSTSLPSDTPKNDPSMPSFPTVPSRWLVVRRLNHQVSEDGKKLPSFQTWIVESNRVRKIQDIDDSVDLEVDVSPFMRAETDPLTNKWTDEILRKQAEVFIGKRVEYSGWRTPDTAWIETEAEGNKDFMDLTVLGSSNPVFPDFVVHNGSTFSIVDSFKYTANDGSTKYLTEAKADYFVIGWNSLPKKDLLAADDQRLAQVLENLKMTLPLPTLTETSTDQEKKERKTLEDLLNTKQSTRSILHGAVYSVSFKWGSKPPSRAEQVAEKFGPKFNMEPLSMGVTPIDGIMTFLRAHKTPADVEKVFGDTDADDIAAMVLALGDLLYAADDSFNERVKAQDMNLYEGHYAKSQDAGYRWAFAAPENSGQATTVATPEQFKELFVLNEKQTRLDGLERQLSQKRWDLFSEWWKYVSDKTNIRNTIQGQYSQRVIDLKQEISVLAKRAEKELRPDLKKALENPSYKRVLESPFYTRREPTLCIAGMDSGWPKDFLDALPIRLDHQITASQALDIFGPTKNPFPKALEATALKILGECVARSEKDFGEGKSTLKGFKSWGNVNPFQPLFVEWEALYYHVDRSKWTVGVRPSPVGMANSQVRYGVNELLSKNTENQRDFRYIRGRSLILPQPVFSLQAAVQAVVDSNDPSSPFKDEASIKKLLDGIGKLQFISCPLSGLDEHLVTRVMGGTHVKPTVNINKQGMTVIPLPPAAQPDIQLFEGDLTLIESRSDLTPYGNMLRFSSDSYPKPPFKGVTHGQMMITKLNIIDKFGQAVALPAPSKKLKNPPAIPQSVHPCLSDFLTPGTFENQINTIYAEDKKPDHGDWPICRFMQLTPSINQDARINACFVNRGMDVNAGLAAPRTKTPFWVETENDKPEETPIFGWVIINYQNSGLQFFRPDGTFYREVRVGGPSGTALGSKWLPFDPPKPGIVKDDSQLDGLIKKLTDKEDKGKFLKSFFHMINGAIKTMPFPPSEYSGYANSLVGKPLALVNVGFSLELAISALTAQNTLGKTPKSEGRSEQDELSSYRFPFKIGDVDRPFDGVVGYFKTDNKVDGKTDWNTMYTYFPDEGNKSFVKISPQNFPRLSPHYINPNTLTSTSTSTAIFNSYRQAQAAQFTIATMLIDPYTPIHAYSPILPIKSLAVPAWTIQKAFTRMTAFFRLGPSLISVDVPMQYDEKRKLDPESWTVPLPDGGASNDTPAMPAIRLPISGKKGLWRWLQPYDVKGKVDTDPHDTLFNEMDVKQEDTTIRKDRPPYTFVEGYLQLARPLLAKDMPRNA